MVIKELSEMTAEEFSEYRQAFDAWHRENIRRNAIQKAGQENKDPFVEGFTTKGR